MGRTFLLFPSTLLNDVNYTHVIAFQLFHIITLCKPRHKPEYALGTALK